ncbi:MAG: PIG-L family deacetylase [Erysipelotrichaceae bacterium]|nr:PIG-L family deacetylase [Erysipelotrichaceae bacterium]MDY5252764.1 PIG-L family deacetylase [Erysipelotrichaceae bacterium]
MKYKNLVSIGGHHLDAELMGGPLLIKYAKQGAQCTFINVTEGRLERKDASEQEKQDYLTKIREENESVARYMGCNALNLHYTAQTLPSEKEFIDFLKNYFIENNIDCVVTHWRGTMHPRHYYTYDTVTKAVLECRAQGHEIQLLYGENCEDLIGFIPTCYVSLNDEIVNTWMNGLKHYSIFNGKVNSVPYEQYYTALLKVRSIEGGCPSPVKAYMHAPLFDNE